MPPMFKKVDGIFVFGSNLAGRHGKAAALDALRYYGARYGQGVGLQGESYGIATKDHGLRVLPLAKIATQVSNFLDFAKGSSDLKFYCTCVGCGEAGFSFKQMAPMFNEAPENVFLPIEWRSFVHDNRPFYDWQQVVLHPGPPSAILL